MTTKGIQAAEAEGLDKKFKMTTTIGTGNMVCFDLNGKIRKYSTAEEILVDFYHKRLEYYGLRKVCHLWRARDNCGSLTNSTATSCR